jgi:VWFA-related protein
MLMSERLAVFLLLHLLAVYAVHAQDAKPLTVHDISPIHLDVVVTEKSGAPVSGLQLEDFTLLDNNVTQTITSFEAVDGRQARAEVVLVIDAVSSEWRELAIEREEVKRFLKADQGHLAYPTTFGVLTETGIQFHLGLSKDGKALSAALDHFTFPRHSLDRDTDRGAVLRRFAGLDTLNEFEQLLVEESGRPGRKLIIWISPHWPVLPDPWHTTDAIQSEQIFKSIIAIVKQLREDRITLYFIDPSGTVDVEPGLTETHTKHTRVSDTVTPSGGLALHPGNDMASALRQCVADASAYYQISFHPAADRGDEYHHLEIRVARPGMTVRSAQGYYSQPPLVDWFTAGSEQPGKAENNSPGAAPAGVSDIVYANAHPYLDWPLAQLTEQIPELKALQPATDQQQLPVILQKMGRTVDDFVHNLSDLIAHEDVTQEKLDQKGKVKAKERVQDNYLIVHHGYEWGANSEYRMDDKGNRLGQVGLSQGYLVTSGHALSCISFCTDCQPQSRFRLLGEETIGTRQTYVLGFAQRPGEVSFTTVMRGTGSHEVDMLTQGILWVDKGSFQILRMRSDLLAPYKEIALDRLTTDVSFGEVRLQEVPNPLWLPSDVAVYIEIGAERYGNLHHYTNYRLYRVSTKIGASQ